MAWQLNGGTRTFHHMWWKSCLGNELVGFCLTRISIEEAISTQAVLLCTFPSLAQHTFCKTFSIQMLCTHSATGLNYSSVCGEGTAGSQAMYRYLHHLLLAHHTVKEKNGHKAHKPATSQQLKYTYLQSGHVYLLTQLWRRAFPLLNPDLANCTVKFRPRCQSVTDKSMCVNLLSD